MRRPVIAIVGAGFSGSLLALHVLSAGPPAPKVFLIERRADFGKGVAYSTGNPGHLLNVRAGNMSAFPDRPGHFLDWLRERDGDQGLEPGSFVPRRTYGGYLQDMLRRAVQGEAAAGRLVLVSDDAVALDRDGDQHFLTLGVGRRLAVDHVVLAIGNLPPETPGLVAGPLADSPSFIADPWAPGALAGIRTDDSVLMLGSGLTMVDVVLALDGGGHRGPVLALSRRGLLPRRHGGGLPPPAGGIDDLARNWSPALSAALRDLRRAVARVEAAGGDWRQVIDGLRPHTVALWQGLSDTARDRFLRHLRPWWDVHRHRLAPSVADRIDSLQAGGRLRVQAGRLTALESMPAGMIAHYQPRRSAASHCTRITHLINCAGPACDLGRVRDSLVRQLVTSGQARPDRHRLGLDVDAHGRLVAADGHAAPHLWAIGPPTRGAFWEITAVPDIRNQARDLANRLVAVCDQPVEAAV